MDFRMIHHEHRVHESMQIIQLYVSYIRLCTRVSVVNQFRFIDDFASTSSSIATR